ncbi:NAD(P)-binding protein [Gymnopus androsaceus JB14]|uniref:NAD(P)-binding protein n=1 Tax=Gymnopus androsaceus JB14 TaxID=1447944 RepID=A0A6A4GUQ6_9AGAR|nr:NAD(P)-binding protein [Gymnopus androsaceus JB14]
MPTIPSGSKVLITGVKGYIASWICAVQSAEKGTWMREIFQEYADKLEFIVVLDITKDGAFNQAVIDVDAIIHTASPVNLNTDDPQVVMVHLEPQMFSEADWGEQAVAEVERDGRNALPMSKYQASKMLAERAAWKFFEDNKDSLKWDLVVFNPPFVFGPIMHDVPIPFALNESAALIYNLMQPDAGGNSSEELHIGNCWIDMQDLGEAHVLALEKEGVVNKRILICAGGFVCKSWISDFFYSHDRADSKLYHTKEETLKDTSADYEVRRW